MPQKQKGPVDRLPIICAAGKPPHIQETAGDLLHIYPPCDLAEKLVKEKDRLARLVPGVPATPIIPENQLRDIISPDLNKSRFLEFKDRFYENLYCKKVPLGKPTPTNSKPDEITNTNFTFGRPNPKAEKLYDLTLPKKTPDQVMREYIRSHDKYRLSHGDYYPSERINRKYTKSFNPTKAYGELKDVDRTGARIKTLLTEAEGTSQLCIISKTQKEFLKQHKSLLGTPLKRVGMEFPVKKVFGRMSIADEYDVKRLLNSTVTPQEITKYANESTYRLFSTDLYNAPPDCRGPAGNMESRYPRKGVVKFYAENLGEETTAKQLISPSIPTHFGLTHRDFMVPRPKDQIYRIFKNAGYDMKDDEFFEKVWTQALKEWTSLGDQVSVEAFKIAYQKITSEAAK